jgi:hypothetical protein
MSLNVVQYEEIASLLQEVPSLVDHLEARRSGFSGDVLLWLKRAESMLESNRLPVVSQISAYRAMLIESSRGIHTNEIAIVGRPTVRKLEEGTASVALQRSNDLLHAAIAEREAAFQGAERVSRQVLAVADAKGLVDACRDGRSHQAFLECLRDRIAADADLAGIYVHLSALVGRTDVLIFLDRALVGLS